MMRARVIPVLLLKDQGLVKTEKFSSPRYIGDPINAVRIFNDKEVDELIFLDITATLDNRTPRFDMVQTIATECFMPFCFGGGLRTVDDAHKVLNLGAEKVALNSIFFESPKVVEESAKIFGSQSIVVVLDVKRTFLGGYRCFSKSGTNSAGIDPVSAAKQAESLGAGEILIQSIDRDGTMQGYDEKLVKSVAEAVNVPVVACGGAGKVDDLISVVKSGGASAAAAGSLFVYYGKHRAVLINFPTNKQLEPLVS